MEALTIFGAIAVSAMLLFYTLESRSSWFVIAFAGACLASSAYGFLQGAWPFGLVELVWSGVALRRWHVRQAPTSP
jgi:presenilin-like A22 family membrane protease